MPCGQKTESGFSAALRDGRHLRTCQYRDSANLNARAELHRRFSTAGTRWFTWVFDQIVSAPGRDVLELGCGPGGLWLENRERVPADWRVTLADFSAGMLDEARANLRSLDRDIAFAGADAQRLPFSDACFDAVVANHMLYHLEDVGQGLSEIRRVLRPGGLLFAATNGANHMRELGDWVRRFDPDTPVGSTAMVRPFDLATGLAQLAVHFDDVRLARYEDGLAVTEVDPLIDYVRSTPTGKQLDPATVDRCRASLEQMLSDEGVLRIHKETGMSAAVRKPGEESAG
jgi:SAM-dependent methyltransferase